MHPIHFSFTSKFLLALAGIGLVAGDFSYPLSEGIQFEIGDTRTIRFETQWEEYSIALWQKQKEGESASLGPVLIETQDGAGKKAFEWDVKTYNLNLEDSQTFFFWIFQGDRSSQGDQSKLSMSSALFKIKGADGDDEKNDPNEVLSSSSSIFLVSKTFISEEPLTTNIVPSGDEAGESSAPPRTVHQPSTTAANSRATTGTSPSQAGDFEANGGTPPESELSDSVGGATAASNTPGDQSPKDSSTMAIATKAGIGVGAGIGGVALMAGVAILIAKYGKIGRTRARSVMATSMLFWCRGRPTTHAGGNSDNKMEYCGGRDLDHPYIARTESASRVSDDLFECETSLSRRFRLGRFDSSTADCWSYVNETDLADCIHCSGAERH